MYARASKTNDNFRLIGFKELIFLDFLGILIKMLFNGFTLISANSEIFLNFIPDLDLS